MLNLYINIHTQALIRNEHIHKKKIPKTIKVKKIMTLLISIVLQIILFGEITPTKNSYCMIEAQESSHVRKIRKTSYFH